MTRRSKNKLDLSLFPRPQRDRRALHGKPLLRDSADGNAELVLLEAQVGNYQREGDALPWTDLKR